MKWDPESDMHRSGARAFLECLQPGQLQKVYDSFAHVLTGIGADSVGTHAARAKQLTVNASGPGVILKANVFTPKVLNETLHKYLQQFGL